MPSTEPKPPLIIILGPTAVGKTETSLQLAERLKGEIISADSRLLYRGMDIGTAKPSLDECQRVPHYLIDVADPDQVWSLAMFLRAVSKTAADIHARGRLPLMVGGTGQYVRAVVEGWQIPEVRPDPRLRTALENWAEEIGSEALYQRLENIDLEAASRIEPQNLRRIVRALEVILTTGQLFSTQRESGSSPYEVLMLGLTRPRQELYERIDARIQKMFDKGLVEETQKLLDQGYSPDLPPLSAIGYRQVIQFLNGEISMDEVVTQMKRITRRFVRHQANWFKEDDPDIQWFRAGPGAIDEMEAVIGRFLHNNYDK
ncbi:MAG: tRNA (adenosine(37)-N6)-dimethylallyltransferase MiaA [Anaerolineales bacterium]|nr:tRNA (adenosine(37)-N6)-dimethylallyltransferase MiaA [Chloroflexota bacterium]MBL7163278.1 tRNA (adenosine(37)-N6)-dimethylallyltransferase MiaA [Anaerolineales bacterium]